MSGSERKSDSLGDRQFWEARVAASNAAMAFTAREILSQEEFAVGEAIRLAGNYFTYYARMLFGTRELVRDQLSTSSTGLDRQYRAAVLELGHYFVGASEMVISQAQMGDFSLLKVGLESRGNVLAKGEDKADIEKVDPQLLGLKFLQMVQVLPDAGEPFEPPKGEWRDRRFRTRNN